jgi:proteasome lid subunit RPN8/RPN11
MDWKTIFAEVKQQSVSAYPEQACGIITKDGAVIACENIFEPKLLRHARYAVNDELAYNLSQRDKLFGFYHSHVNGSPDLLPTDVYDAGKFPGVRHVIVGVLGGVESALHVSRARVYIAQSSLLGVLLVPCGPVDEDA